jgi:8-oxo-dGTP diphosphatase
MPNRPLPARAPARPLTLAVDVVLFTPRGSELAVLLGLVTGAAGGVRARDRRGFPSDSLRGEESLADTAARVARVALDGVPSLLDQATTLGGARRVSEGPNVTVTYFGLVPDASATRRDAEWISISELSALPARQKETLDSALTALRARVDQQPIAFRLLPAAFTLSELQAIYELLLGRRLHKASFRRSLHAAGLVEATDEWRSEGRGRPAQLFRYAPPRRRRQRRGVRFDLLG